MQNRLPGAKTLLLAVAFALIAGDACAQPFYRGKTITIISGGGTTGGYDAYAHLLARHMKKHIPGAPTLIVRSMPGAASLLAANYLYNIAAPDGLTFAGFLRTIPMAAILGNPSAKYQPEKLTWIGSSSRYLDDAYLLYVNKSLGITALDQLRGRREPLRLGTTGPTSQADESARVIRDVLGLNIQIVRGYSAPQQIMLATERGEVDGTMVGVSSTTASRPDWLKADGPINVLVQIGYGGEGRNPLLPNVPRIDEFAKTAEDKAIFSLLQLPYKISRPFAGPPGMPADLTRILREAFMQTHADPDYLSDARKLGVYVSPLPGQEAARIVADAVALPQSLVKRYADILAKTD